MTLEFKLTELSSQSADDFQWKPSLLRLAEPADRRVLEALIDEGRVASVHDGIAEQIRELVATRDPRRKLPGPELDARVAAHVGDVPLYEYGTWVYYPWSRRLVHVLPEPEFRELRSSRNRYKITSEEQKRLGASKIGVIGLSVGLASAVTLALEGVGGEIRLADFDLLALSNMNRLRTPLHHLGVNKSVIAARELVELDPYLKVKVFPSGLTEETIELFLLGGGKLDLVVEECDDLYMKVLSRERARAHGIPVIMETNDRGMLDIERFDLEPDRPVLHGLLAQVSAKHIKGLTSSKDKVPYVLRIFGGRGLETRTLSSLFEIEQSISSWPQLASGVALGGAMTTDTARRILLGQLRESGRYYVNFDDIIKDGAAADLAVDHALDEAANRKPPPPSELPELTPVGARITADDVRAIVTYGTLAPSAGNAQPWRFVAQGGSLLRCLVDESRAWVFLDFDRSATYAALGAAVENIDLACRAKGIVTSVHPFPDPKSRALVCEIELAPAPPGRQPKAPPLAAQMSLRVTNRKKTERRPLAPAAQNALIEAAQSAGGRLELLTDPAQIAEVGALVGGTDRLSYLTKRLHQELTSEVRWTREEVERTRDGVDVASLDLSPSDLAGMRLAMSWPSMEFLRSFGGGHGLGKMSRDMIEAGSGVGLVVMPGSGPEAYFRGGRAMERVWLTATSLGLGMHPLSGIAYLFARLERGSGTDFPPEDVQALRELRARYLRIFKVSPRDEVEVLLFRLTHAGPAAVRSLRRPVEEVLVFEEAWKARLRAKAMERRGRARIP